MRSQFAAFAAALALSVAAACQTRSSPQPAPATSRLEDLSTSLDAVRAAFNARKGQARFLTLLSPT